MMNQHITHTALLTLSASPVLECRVTRIGRQTDYQRLPGQIAAPGGAEAALLPKPHCRSTRDDHGGSGHPTLPVPVGPGLPIRACRSGTSGEMEVPCEGGTQASTTKFSEEDHFSLLSAS
jgi:hypothetical protein